MSIRPRARELQEMCIARHDINFSILMSRFNDDEPRICIINNGGFPKNRQLNILEKSAKSVVSRVNRRYINTKYLAGLEKYKYIYRTKINTRSYFRF